MRKTNHKAIIGGVLALTLILTGTGYAYWTDTLNINTKATTGELEVTFADLGLYAQYDNETVKDGWSIVDGVGDKGYVADDFFMRGSSDYNAIAKKGSIDEYKKNAEKYNSVDFDAELKDAKPIKKDVGPYTTANTNGSDQINIKINSMYPGYAQAFRTDVLNVGSIAAKLGGLKFDIEVEKGSEHLDDMLGIALYIHQEQYVPSNIEKSAFKLAKALNLKDEDFFTVGGVDFVRLSAFQKIKPEEIAKALDETEILTSPATDNRLDVFLGVAMDPDKDGVYTTGSVEKLNDKNDDSLTENKFAEISIDFLWDQFNVGKDAGNGNILIKQNR